MDVARRDERDKQVERLARQLDRAGLAGSAVLFLESHRPAAFLFSQALLFAEPLLGALLKGSLVRDVAALLDDPASLDRLLALLEGEP